MTPLVDAAENAREVPDLHRRDFLESTAAAGLTLLFPRPGSGAVRLEDGWKNPPRSCRPHTRWWWPGSAVSRDGIDTQLRQMKANGIGGVEIICCWEWYQKGNIPYLSEEWRAMLRHTMDRAAELDMEVALTYSPGWDLAGFWVPPEDRSKVLAPVWVDLEGPVEFARALPAFDRSKTPTTGLYAYLTEPEGNARDAHKLVAAVAGRLTGANRLDGSSLVDLTAQVQGDVVRWRVPEGRWRISGFRLEYTGQQNASQNYVPRNWIVDHYSKAAMQRYCDYLTGAFREAFGDRLGRVVDAFFSDSFEVMPLRDTVLWSNALLSDFRARKGYELTRYLPAIWWDIGELTPKVRYDVNEFLHQTVMDAVYDTFRESAASVSVESKTQPHYRFSAETIQGAGAAARPETEVTTVRFETVADPRKATVAGARFYGRSIVSAEAYTFLHQQRYRTTPEELKIATDAFLRDGITQIYNHGFVYTEERDVSTSRDLPFAERISPWNTWWPYYRHVADYVARSCFVCRQGEIVADVLVYSPQAEVWTSKAVWNGERRVMPYGDLPKTLLANGYDYDPVNDDVLQRLASGDSGQIRVRNLRWRVLILQNVTAMPVETLRAVVRLIEAGVPVIALGRLPERSTGMHDWSANDAEVRRLASRIPHFLPEYTFVDVPFVSNEQPYRKTPPLRPAQRKFLSILSGIVDPDFRIGAGEQSDGLTFQHRRSADADIYFLTNLQPAPVETRVTVRATGSAVEWWDARTGEVKLAEGATVRGGRTELPVAFAPWESAFVVVRRSGGQLRARPKRPAAQLPAPVEVTGPWEFRGGGVTRSLTRLGSWNSDPALASFSGTAEYECSIAVPADWSRRGRRVLLDLGSVGCVAEVAVNGRACGVVWIQPWQADVTAAVRPGQNRIVVKVTNLMIHRVRAMKEPPPVPVELRTRYGGEREDYTSAREFTQSERALKELPPSGLLGPVRLLVR